MTKTQSKKHQGTGNSMVAERNGLHLLLSQFERDVAAGNRPEPETMTGLLAHGEAPEDADMRLRWRRGRVFSLLHLDRIGEAEQENESACRDYPNHPDFAYYGCRIAYRMGEYPSVLTSSRHCLSLISVPGADTNEKATVFTATALWQAHLFEMIGEAAELAQAYDEARRAYEQATVVAPKRSEGYRRLALLHRRRNDLKSAETTLQQGIRMSSDATELHMLAQTWKRHATVSACMIVKNEEEQLPRCLESIRDWVDEIIIVDTGSTDRTVAIAQAYGARLFHQPWEGDFSKHRNYSLDQAAGDWVFIIDADEEFRLEDLPRLRQALDETSHEIVSIDVFNVYGRDQSIKTFLPSIRFFRRRLNLRYSGIVHNTLTLPSGATVARAAVQLKHYGYDLAPDKMKQKFERSRVLLEKQLAEDPDNYFALFNYAQLLRGAGEETLAEYAPKIIAAAERAVALTNPLNPMERHIHLMCLDQLGWISMFVREYDRAIRYAERAIAIKPDYLDPLLLFGHACARARHYDRAAEAYRRYLTIQEQYDSSRETENIILMHVDSRAQAYYGLAIIAELQNRPDEARRWYALTTEATPHHLDANLNLARLFLQDDKEAEAERCYRRHLEADPESLEGLLGLAYVERRKGNQSAAGDLYRKVLMLEQNHPVAMLKLGELHLEGGNDGDAQAILSELCRVHPEKVRDAAECYVRAGRHHKAVSLYESWLRDHKADSATLTDLGNCYFKMGNLEQAEDRYSLATETIPVCPGAFRNYGLVLARRGAQAEARDSFEQYLRMYAEDLEIRKIVVDMCLKEGQFAQAVPHLEALIKTEPGDLRALTMLSECYLQLGHTDAAMAGFRHVLSLEPENIAARQRLEQVRAVSAST
jgi:tetratricopeptide (TPR) repeat protein